jgi:hypothetical protein
LGLQRPLFKGVVKRGGAGEHKAGKDQRRGQQQPRAQRIQGLRDLNQSSLSGRGQSQR